MYAGLIYVAASSPERRIFEFRPIPIEDSVL
jgi:hypothetical protein